LEPTRKIFVVSAWQSALQVRNFRLKIAIGVLLLVLCAMVAPVVFQYVQQRSGTLINDPLLNLLPSVDLSVWIFLILYSLIIYGTITLAADPARFLVTLKAYVILTIFRFITLLLTPLEPPSNMAALSDPFVEHLFYQQPITKDLFFSGHTSLLVLFALTLRKGFARKILFAGAITIAVMLLLQHAHYTVDIIFAPVFSWLAFRLSRGISGNLSLETRGTNF